MMAERWRSRQETNSDCYCIAYLASTKPGSDRTRPDHGLDHGPDHGSDHGSDHGLDHGLDPGSDHRSDHSKKKTF